MHKQNYKVDFMGLISVSHANPNGDPLCGGRPRIDSAGYGLITDVCLKRKLRNRLLEMNTPIFVSPPDHDTDTLEHRASEISCTDKHEYARAACKRWFDVRGFGQVFSFAGRRSTVSVRGPVTIQHAFSVDPIAIEELPITRCINSSSPKKRAPDTLGFRSYVQYGLYIMKGSVCASLAEKTGFSEQDCIRFRNALLDIFTNDASSARPDGSMTLERLYWWNHHSACGDYSSASVFNTIHIRKKVGIDTPMRFSDYDITETHLAGLTPRIFANVIPEQAQECGSE